LGNVADENPCLSQLETLKERILDLDVRITQSQEIKSLLNGFDGGYIPAGPSELITRGRDDVLPTGRNFYTLDHQRVPTKAAAIMGRERGHTLDGKRHYVGRR
jgi:cobaltochelatase CobN